MTSEAQGTQTILTLTKEHGMEHILRMSLQFTLDTTTYINLQKLAWSHCLLYAQYLSPYLQKIFFVIIFLIVLMSKKALCILCSVVKVGPCI